MSITTMMMNEAVEESCVLVGKRRGPVLIARRKQHTTGRVASVEADARWALKREEEKGDVLGFWHTHPSGVSLSPSLTDEATMAAWVECLGKNLLCLIANRRKVRALLFLKEGGFVELQVKPIWGSAYAITGANRYG